MYYLEDEKLIRFGSFKLAIAIVQKKTLEIMNHLIINIIFK